MKSWSERTHSSSHEAVSTALHRDEVFKKKKRGRICVTVSRMFCSPESEVCNVDFFCRTPVHYLPFRECHLHSPLATRRVIGGHLGVVFPHSGFSAPVTTFVSQRYSLRTFYPQAKTLTEVLEEVPHDRTPVCRFGSSPGSSDNILCLSFRIDTSYLYRCMPSTHQDPTRCRQ